MSVKKGRSCMEQQILIVLVTPTPVCHGRYIMSVMKGTSCLEQHILIVLVVFGRHLHQCVTVGTL